MTKDDVPEGLVDAIVELARDLITTAWERAKQVSDKDVEQEAFMLTVFNQTFCQVMAISTGPNRKEQKRAIDNAIKNLRREVPALARAMAEEDGMTLQ